MASIELPGDTVHVRVRDGRPGRDPALVEGGLGELLFEYDVDEPPDIGDLVDLPDGTSAKIIGTQDDLSADGWVIDATVAETWT